MNIRQYMRYTYIELTQSSSEEESWVWGTHKLPTTTHVSHQFTLSQPPPYCYCRIHSQKLTVQPVNHHRSHTKDPTPDKVLTAGIVHCVLHTYSVRSCHSPLADQSDTRRNLRATFCRLGWCDAAYATTWES